MQLCCNCGRFNLFILFSLLQDQMQRTHTHRLFSNVHSCHLTFATLTHTGEEKEASFWNNIISLTVLLGFLNKRPFRAPVGAEKRGEDHLYLNGYVHLI